MNRSRSLRTAAIVTAALFFVSASVAVLRGLRLESRQISAAPAPVHALDEEAIAGRLGRAIRFRTISSSDVDEVPSEEFAALRDYLAASYPLVSARLRREIVADHSLLFTWQGRNPSAPPLVLMGHQDVVPVEDPEAWTHPPFGGVVADGKVWGRGAFDNKYHLIAILEAVEHLLAADFVPEPTVYLVFGHDEELGGHRGASKVADLLQSRGVRPGLVLDEGGAAFRSVIPFVGGRPVGAIAIAEKGAANVELIARNTGPAHSAVPLPKTPVGVLASAIHRLEANQLPSRMTPAVDGFLEYLGPELPLLGRILIANRTLFGSPLRTAMLRKPETAAFVRTTTAATMFEGSSKENLIPERARAVINFRILTGETVESTLEHVRHAIADDSIEVSHYRSRNPSSASPTDSNGFEVLQWTIAETMPDVIVAPWLSIGGTDSRHFRRLTESVYGFNGGIFSMDDLEGPHGRNEFLRVEELLRSVRFYRRLIENAGMLEENGRAL